MSANGVTDTTQWLSVNEESLFLHDGLLRVSDLVQLPKDINNANPQTDSDEVVSFDTKNPTELSQRLLSVCERHNNIYAYSRLLEYRLNALKGLWDAHRQISNNVEQLEREALSEEESGAAAGTSGGLGVLKKSNQHPWHAAEPAAFSSRLGLLLVFPLLRSQQKTNPELSGETAVLLLNCLRDCPPLSLSKEPADCLDGLENLLSSWLGEIDDTRGGRVVQQQEGHDAAHKQNLAAALVALACARGSVGTLIHTTHLLQQLEPSLSPLPVADILQRLLRLEGGPGSPSSLLGNRHVVCWGFEDMLGEKEEKTDEKDKEKDSGIGRSLACDGIYLYCSNARGKGLAKVGSGLHGTLRGFVYARNPDIPVGWVACSEEHVIHRPLEADSKSEVLASVINKNTLKIESTIKMPESLVATSQVTVALCSDGTYFYRVWCPPGADKSGKGQPVTVDTFQLTVQGDDVTATPLRQSFALQRNDDALRGVNDPLLVRLRTYRASTAATLAQLTGANNNASGREEASTTSCGLTLKLLRKSPIYCCGSSVVIVTLPPGGSGSATTRSLFSTTGGLSGLRTLATSLCFSLSNGLMTNRVDLMDAPACAIARGANVQGLGICYDVTNNSVWTCSTDWVDQWHNPGLRATHHVCKQLGVPRPPLSDGIPQDNMLSVSEVVRLLLHHVGSSSCHKVHSDPLQSPLGRLLVSPNPPHLPHLIRLCAILEKALGERNVPIVQCMLVVLQVVFKSHSFNPESQAERDIVDRARKLVWDLLTTTDEVLKTDGLMMEACYVIKAGLSVLFHGTDQINGLLHQLLGEGERHPALGKLRDMILVELARQLRQAGSKDNLAYKIDDGLVQLMLNISVRESRRLLQQCLASEQPTDSIVANVPIASPCQQFLTALEIHILENVIMLDEQRKEDGSPGQGDGVGDSRPTLVELQTTVLKLATKILSGCEEILETLLSMCNDLLNSEGTNQMQVMERVVKGSILGYLLPVLVTSLRHPNLKCLTLAESLVPQVVRLVVLISQVALLLGNNSQQDKKVDKSGLQPHDVVTDLLASHIKDKSDKPPQNYLTNLRIPAPWAAGKTVETIHPVRDNYKFRETVHIPGARCLYLRFEMRCASQYDYDKVVIYGGPNTNSRKVAEYGGNTYGYGSRSVLGSGWPKDLVKVEGDTVTFNFEMRSGREHNTPDKALWGFSCTVRAQESSEESTSGLPFVADLALGLSVLASGLLKILYEGPEVTAAEQRCHALLSSRLMQRCAWHQMLQQPHTVPPGPSEQTGSETSLPRLKLSQETLQRVRGMSGQAVPFLRPSIKEVLQSELIEEAVVSAAAKHLGLDSVIRSLGADESSLPVSHQNQGLVQILVEVHSRVQNLLRQLQFIAEMEQNWENEVDEFRNNDERPASDAFFNDYHLQEDKKKSLEILCFIKDVDLETMSMEEAIRGLKSKLVEESKVKQDQAPPKMAKTRSLVAAILDRAEALLEVAVATEGGSTAMARSISQHIDEPGVLPWIGGATPASTVFSRSVSLPADLATAKPGTADKHSGRAFPMKRSRSSAYNAVPEHKHKHNLTLLLDDLFAFIGTKLQHTVSKDDFLSAVRARSQRGGSRQRALVHAHHLLTTASHTEGYAHLVTAITTVLQHGPKIENVVCGGVVDEVRQAFADAMTAIVKLATCHPTDCAYSIGLLCTIPYTRSEEQCLVDSQLVSLLDRLCSLGHASGQPSRPETQSSGQRVSALAWAGFQVLANRCVSWETDEISHNALGHAGLARQVSLLLTNHLARATESCGNEAAGSEALQEVLSLLNNLSRSRMGRAILSQPACVSKLLSLLLDQRPSPKLVLIILQLCRVALPLMSADDCAHVQLPAWGQELSTSMATVGGGGATDDGEATTETADPPARIASLLLAKLGDCVVPGCQTMLAPEQLGLLPSSNFVADLKDDMENQDGRLSVFLHKREDQTSREVIQSLLSTEGRPFRLGSGANMEKVLRMDRNMHTTGKAELFTEDAATAIQKAGKLAQAGFLVSVGTPVDAAESENNNKEKMKVTAEAVCREKNAELARTDPVRPFISGHVANSMASEVIALMHSLLTAPESHTAEVWASAVERVLSHALSLVPVLISSQSSHVTLLASQPQGPAIDQLLSTCRQVVAAFCALGGFRDCVKTSSTAQIVGEGCLPIEAQVLSIAEQQGVASVSIADDDIPKICNPMDVAMARLQPPKNIVLPLQQLSITEKLVAALHSLLLPQEEKGSCPMLVPLPAMGDGNSQAMATCRVLADIRTRACAVLAFHMKEPSFATEFVKQTNHPLEVLKSLSQQCGTGERQKVVEVQCEKLRMLYRDCARPPTPPAKQTTSSLQDMAFEPARSYPPIKACLFSRCMTSLTFLGDPASSGGLPTGVMCYATQAVPNQAPSFYWELEICSYGDAAEESGPNVSMGLAPPAEKRDGANNWTNPIGTVLFPVSGHAIHYSGASLLRWKSVRLDISLKVGDIIGMGWQRDEDSAPGTPGQAVKGHVFMTLNGHKFAPTLEEVSGGLWPVVHVQKKNTQVRANFGSRPFAYVDGHCHHTAALESSDSEEIAANFGALPFHGDGESDSDREGTPPESPSNPTTSEVAAQDAGTAFKFAMPQKPKKEYDATASQHYMLPGPYADFTTTGLGPHQTAAASMQDDSDEEERGGEAQQDHVALLVRAWELKVFPVIRRRFRNEAERRSGLEQIKGALQLGMTDIARQTVEFLYEENGGIPRDLHLPTIDDVKIEAAKFTIDKVRKGTTVMIHPLGEESTSSAGGTLVPKYAIRSMLKTLGLSGVVLDVDTQHELVQVESYLKSEGVLVRYWYPLDMLKRPQGGIRRASSSLTGTASTDISNIQLHRELLQCESSLARLYCRTALTELLSHCPSPELIEAIPCSLASTEISASAGASGGGGGGGSQQDISHLQLLSNQLLTAPQQNGRLCDASLLTSSGPSRCLAPLITRSLTAMFYGPDEWPQLKRELAISIATAAQQGERHLLELTNQICGILQEVATAFDVESIPIGEKINNNIIFKNAVALVVSCQRDPSASHRESSPWARVSCYGMGHRVKKSGCVAPLEVVSYPADTAINNSGGLTTPQAQFIDPFPTVVLPCNKVHVRAGASPSPKYIMNIHGLPAEFPLAVAYVESLIGCRQQVGDHKVKGQDYITLGHVAEPKGEREEVLKKPVKITTGVYVKALELLSGYVCHADMPALIKEHLFHVMAQVLRLIRKVDAADGASAAPITMIPHTLLGELRKFRCELGKLFDEEALLAVIGSGNVTPGHHTSYFQSLMELCLAVSEIDQYPTASQTTSTTTTSSTVTITVPTPKQSSTSPKPLVRSSPQVTSRKRRPKVKRATPQKRTPHNSESDSGEASSNGANHPEDMLWFHRASTLNLILRYLDSQDPQGESSMRTAIRDAHQSQTTESTAHSRLVIISGLPPNMEEPAARRAIMKACNLAGGLYQDELWIPVQEEVKPPMATDVEPKEDDLEEELPPQTVVQDHEKLDSDTPTDGGQGSHETPGDESVDTHHKPERTSDSVTAATQEDVGGDAATEVQSDVEGSDGGDSTDKKRYVQGFAVVEVRSKAKVEDIEHALLNSRILDESLPYDNSSVMSVTGEDLLTIATVNPSLFTEPSEMEGFVGYLKHKLLCQGSTEQLALNPKITQVMRELFNSCLRCTHLKPHADGDSEAGHPEICLTKEQILCTLPGNLLYEFFNAAHPVKQTVEEYVGHVLQKYGVPMPEIKEKKTAPKVSKESSKSTGRRPSKTLGKDRHTSELASVKLKTAAAVERKGKSLEKSSHHKDVGSKEKGQLEDAASHKDVEPPKGLNLQGLLGLALDRTNEDVSSLWRGLLASGYDLHFTRTRHEDPNKALVSQQSWTSQQDRALVHYTNELCLKLAITPARLQPEEIFLSEADLARTQYSCLQGVPLETIRLRYAFLQSLNANLEHHFLPLVDLRPSQSLLESTAALLARTREWLFYDTKVRFFNMLLDATAQRNVEQAAPEVSLDPLQVIGTSAPDNFTNFSLAASALANVFSAQLCVKIASGGDPTYAFNVRLIGEEVHGTSGSFRHFLGEVTHELQGNALRILMPCPSGAVGRNSGRYLLRPDTMTYPEEKMLVFFGQLLGIAMRADIPLALDLLPSVWKCLVQEPLDPDLDLAEADIITHRTMKRMDQAENEEEFESVCGELVAGQLHHHLDAVSGASSSSSSSSTSAPLVQSLHFVYPNIMGELVELCPNGHEISVSWSNRHTYTAAVRDLRLRELACPERMLAVRCGLASIIPHQLLTLMTAEDIELRTCGRPQVDLALLKAHTMYQVGLVETDTHIEYFWHALESFSQEELSRFIKFACNQERIPSTCPCRQGTNDAAHVPPYPMKIAPPDGPGSSPDQRFIRVETCMFMIKLPQYSSLQVMKEKLLYAINCREDPLSG